MSAMPVENDAAKAGGKDGTGRPSVAELEARVRELLPAIRSRARETEKARQVPAQNIDALRRIGYFKLVKPRAYGGFEFGFDVFARLNMELAKACASTAWVAGLLAAHQWVVAAFPREAQKDVWDANAEALICGSYMPAAKASADERGWRLSGRWSFASGCDNAHWAICGAQLPSADAAGTAPVFVLVPASDYAIDDTWDVAGLAGTGSKTLVLKDVFIPAHRVVRVADMFAGKTPGAALYPQSPGFSVPMLCNMPCCLVSVAIGAASGALEDYVASVIANRTSGPFVVRIADLVTVQLRVAEAAAALDAAREIMLRDLRERAATVQSGREVSVEERIVSRRGHTFAASLALRAIEALNASTGGHGLDLGNSVQRAWRDVNAAARHISLNWDAVGSMYGQMALGLEPRGQY